MIFLAGCVNNPDYVALGNLPPHGGQGSPEFSSGPERPSRSESGTSTPSSTTGRPPAANRVPPPRSESPPDVYEVQAGDTLYSIAFRYSMDYEDLAAANDIAAPFTIVPGQEIEMTTDVQPSRAASAEPSAPSRPSGSASATGSASTQSEPEPGSQNSATSAPATNTDSGSVSSWIWPVEGNIVRPFTGGTSGSKGIDIDAPLGESVRAAADGRVVYAGDGLRGYGNLIILEHAGRMLSAYAFTESISVDEQQEVKQGDTIASVGSRGDTPLLHFEIRQEGAPVDPVGYLPSR